MFGRDKPGLTHGLHFQGVCRKALTGQLVVHGAWSHAPVVALPEGGLHLVILRDNIADARQPFMCANWAAGAKQFRDLGMGSPFISSGMGALDSLGFMSRSAKRE